MNKLFIIQNNKGKYADELQKAYDIVENPKNFINLESLTIDYLISNDIDVVVANGLSIQWYYIFKGLRIVSITFDDRIAYNKYSDIIIDCMSNDDRRYFTGEKYLIQNNGNTTNFNVNEIVNLITQQSWDSDFFGFKMAFLSCMHLTDNIVYRTERFIKSENIHLVQYLCNCHDRKSVIIAEKCQYSFVDIRLTYSKDLKDETTSHNEIKNFGLAGSKDIERLQDISSELYADSRYFFDGNFNNEKINEFYQGWVKKGVLGQFDDECWCIYKDKEPVAFCTLKYGDDHSAVIGLVGVDSNYQGRGLGKSLLQEVFKILIRKGIDKVYVVTQGRNYAAQRLYQCAGFRTDLTQLWYHKWI
ncbi:MAG: GNAT family N-acetyltransferase [Bacteroidetes bacterium]|nr:GNAT family N-acetyltransferase [Bacteroidota bacterium]